MKFDRAARMLVGWIAAGIVLFAALAPTVSHALVAASGISPSWAEICSAAGLKRVQVDAGSTQAEPAPPAGTMADHCPYCTLQSHATAPPPVPIATPLLLTLSFDVPERFLTAPRTPYAWTTAQARAPPQHT